MATPFTINTARPGTGPKVASEAAVNFCGALMLEKATATGADIEAATAAIYGWLAGRTAREVSDNIDRLKVEGFTGRGRATVAGTTALPSGDVVPAGRYAVFNDDQSVNDIAFYKVDRPDTGKWAGYVFVKQIVGPDEQRLSKANTAAVLNKIAAEGADVASARFGHETRKCGVCNTNLTNKASRERGIGPDCAKNMGW
jgi:hypothetical protein